MIPKYYKDNGNLLKLKRALRIKGVKNMTIEELEDRINSGDKLVLFRYNMFFYVYLVKGTSSIHLYRNWYNGIMGRILTILLSALPMVMNPYLVWIIFGDRMKESLISLVVFLLIMIVGIIVPLRPLVETLRGGYDMTEPVMKQIRSDNFSENMFRVISE